VKNEKMKNDRNGKIALFGILALFVALTVPSVSAGVDLYFSPDPAQIPGGPPNTVTVQVLIDSAAGDTVDAWGTWIKFDPTCVNITGYSYQTITSNTLWIHSGDRIKLWNYQTGCQQFPNGTALLNLTVQCENPAYCVSPLEFIDNGVPPDKFVACIMTGRTATWHNGTVIQGEPPVEEPDLNVTSITTNPLGASGYAFANEWNNIKAEILEGNGTTVTDPFYVRFDVTGPESFTRDVLVDDGIIGGTTKEVWCNDSWTPTQAPQLYHINVTVDSQGDITEIDEGNNSLDKPQMVNYNGYKGKRFTNGDDIETWQFHEGHVNLIYSAGDSKHQGGYNNLWTTYRANWTAGNLTIPDGATIEKASLNVYYTFERTPSSNVTDYWTLDFNTCLDVPIDQHYTDRKGYSTSYDYPSGMVRYNVTSCFDASGNQVVLDNAEPTTPHHASLSGMVLMVVYENETEPYREIWINEGFDVISARDAYSVNSTEAMAYVPFTPAPDNPISQVEKATLITVMQDAFDGDDSNRLYFGNGEWHGIWNNAAKMGATTIAANETDVKDYYIGPGNYEACLQSHIPAGSDRGDGMGASKVILMLEKSAEVNVKVPCNNVILEGGQQTVPIILEGIDDYGAGTINLFYDVGVVDVIGVTDGPQSTVAAWNKMTPGHIKVSAQNVDGVSGDITFANVEFETKGTAPACSDLNLTVDTLYDTGYNDLPYITSNCSICILETNEPVVTYPNADPQTILNDNGRGRCSGTNLSQLNVTVADDTCVQNVTIDLTAIFGGPGNYSVPMSLIKGTNLTGTWSIVVNAPYEPGVDLTHCLPVNATDKFGNSNTAQCVTLTVLRRGDVVRNNLVNIVDAYYIARYTVGLEAQPDPFVADVVGLNGAPDICNGVVDMADALYIARADPLIGLEPQP